MVVNNQKPFSNQFSATKNQFAKITGINMGMDVTTERKEWRRLVKTVARAQRVDSTG